MAQTKRSFVQRVDFITSFGFGDGGDHRQRLGIRTAGPTLVITDLCVMQPDPSTKELVATALHPGVTREQVVENTGWPIRFADPLGEPPPPTPAELSTLRDLQRRTTEAHTRGRTPRTQPEGSDPLARAVIPSERSESRDLHSGSAP
jgi:glutaconate CoA-transferase subunit B